MLRKLLLQSIDRIILRRMIALGKKHCGPLAREGFIHFIRLIGAILIVACAQDAGGAGAQGAIGPIHPGRR
jgi:hypothetical protein